MRNSGDNVTIPHIKFLWQVIKHVSNEMYSWRLTGVQVFSFSVLGLLFIPQIARLSLYSPFYHLCAFSYYVCWYGCVLESTHFLFRLIEWHRMFFCCGGH